jgi:hypothetical protein
MNSNTTQKDIAHALALVIELPAYLATFVILWIIAWLCAITALVLALVTFGKVTIPPMSASLAGILRMPKQGCLSQWDSE